LDPQDFGYLDPDPEKYEQKPAKKSFKLSKPKSELLKIKDYEISCFLNGLS